MRNEVGGCLNNHMLGHIVVRILELITCNWEYDYQKLFRHVYPLFASSPM
jgi:hypothetical protein